MPEAEDPLGNDAEDPLAAAEPDDAVDDAEDPLGDLNQAEMELLADLRCLLSGAPLPGEDADEPGQLEGEEVARHEQIIVASELNACPFYRYKHLQK